MGSSKLRLPERVKRWRAKRKWSMRKLADIACLSAPTIMRLERGNGVELQTWVAVGKAIGEDERALIREYHETRGRY